MAEALEIDFQDALAQLQPLLGREVCVVVNVRGSFSGCTMEGELVRVLTLPPDNAAVQIVIGRKHAVVLDPEDVSAVLIGNPPNDWLEFHLPGGVVVRLEAA
jgi:hypothetical protein